MTGFMATDSVKLDSETSTKIPLFKFYAILSQQGIDEKFDGIMGFSRQYQTSEYSSGPLIIE